MEKLAFCCDFFCMIISLVLVLKNLKKIRLECRYVIYYIFIFIYVIPLFLDYIIGLPDYTSTYFMATFKGFIDSYNNFDVRILYDIFIIINQLIILYYKPKYKFVWSKKEVKTKKNYDNKYLSSRMVLLLLFFASIGPLLAIISGFSKYVFWFGWRENGLGIDFIYSKVYTTLEKLTYIGVVAALFFILSVQIKEKNIKTILLKLFGLILLYMNICIESKRSIVYFVIIFIALIKFYKSQDITSEKLKMDRIPMGALSIGIIIMIIIIYTSIFVKTGRGYSTFASLYTTFRVDLFRDDTVKFAIYSLIDKQTPKILDYPFQSFINLISSIFPLDLFVGKGLINLPRVGYNTYLTSALIHADISLNNSFMTTSIYDEFIANFSYLGFPLFSFLVVRFSKILDSKSVSAKMLGIGAIILMNFYSLNYIMYYLECVGIIFVLI